MKNLNNWLLAAGIVLYFSIPMTFALYVATFEQTNFYYGPQKLEKLYGTREYTQTMTKNVTFGATLLFLLGFLAVALKIYFETAK